MTTIDLDVRGPRGRRAELGKLSAFFRRDLLIAWSYRTVFLSDLAGLGLALVSFYFVGLMVDPAVLPSYGGERASYMEFVAVGIIFGVFVSIGLGRISTALRSEQLTGTLESVLLTPTSPTTIQLGSIVYELAYIPIRTALFFALIALTFGIDIEAAGILPATAVFVAFFPFVWGLGVVSAAAALTLRRAGMGIGLAVALMTLFSGAYFPLDLLPDWIAQTAPYNPIGITLEGMRASLLGGAGLDEVTDEIVKLVPISLVSLAAGAVAFRLAMARERRTGTLGLY